MNQIASMARPCDANLTVVEPTLGWTLLSRAALRHAERSLNEDQQGVRDEIGFLRLHQAYANRFFPGTSVLQTRLRYTLFIPWIYQRIAESGARTQIAERVQQEELRLVARLKKSKEEGIIGGRTFPRPVSQPASMVYWNALTRWQIVHAPPGQEPPNRGRLHRHLGLRRPSTNLRDDDHDPLDPETSLFVGVPSPPKEWFKPASALTFILPNAEREFVRRQWMTVERRVDGRQTLLARMADQRLEVDESDLLWSENVRRVADADDAAALVRAEQVAAFSAIGRAIYAALTETLRVNVDGLPTPELHREQLDKVLARYSRPAIALDIPAVLDDEPALAGSRILEVLRETKAWLQGSKRALSDLEEVYATAELRRKRQRARLPRTLTARQRRAEWEAEKHPPARPIGYRWYRVHRMLTDLNGAG
ncbi:DUF6361 family protein [Plesiocystis pacifica]|uniref:DUF6361 family protein n=1 Tax=Plesiocystis pacifica TaxID=191768 RepID=UPI0006A702AF|nr:DUF6361 family protein [Plesiocystis pacifica]